MNTDDQREILHDLNKAKVVFQARTVAAVMGFDPDECLREHSRVFSETCSITSDEALRSMSLCDVSGARSAVQAAYARGLSDGKGEG